MTKLRTYKVGNNEGTLFINDQGDLEYFGTLSLKEATRVASLAAAFSVESILQLLLQIVSQEDTSKTNS